ncbi:MAG: replication initiation factor domain-containing protein [Clostridia bacterium]|nr:replication initiation factor domain-containing protein [Clostridia bacterium]
MQQHKLLIDWLSFTSKIHSKHQLIEYLGLEDVNWQTTRGAHGYKSRLYYDCMSIHFDGSPDQGVWVELSGQGCRAFETYGTGDYDAIFDLINANPDNMNLTRLDVAFDDRIPPEDSATGILQIDQIRDDTLAGNFVSRCRTWDVHVSSHGTTVSIGSNKSNILIRIYDKAAERHLSDGTHWVRVELQLRDNLALSFVNLPYEIGERFTGVLANYLQYVEPSETDSNKWRWPLRPYWANLLEEATALSIYEKPGVEYNVLHCEDYVYKQAGNAIDALIQIYGVDTFMDKLKNRGTIPSPKYKKLVDDTRILLGLK